MKRSYENVFIPLADTYNLGGPSTFTELANPGTQGEKNLLVFPAHTLDDLQRVRRGSQGAQDTLEYLEERKERTTIDNVGSIIPNFMNGLDVLFLGDMESREKTSTTELYRQVNEAFNIKEGSPEIITTEPLENIVSTTLNLRVQPPKFLRMDATVMDDAMLTGNNELFAALQNTQKGIPASDAAEMLGEESLFQNQLIRFLGVQRDDYARVVGNPMIVDGRMLDVQNMRVHLVHRDEHNMAIREGERRRKHILGVTPHNMEQYFALKDGLLNPNVSIVFLSGQAGSGKSLLAYAGAMDQVMVHNNHPRGSRIWDADIDSFRKAVIFKATDLVGGREVGFLPGDMYAKMEEQIKPFIDAHEDFTALGNRIPFEQMLYRNNVPNRRGGPRDKNYASVKIEGAKLPENEAIEVTNPGHIRGRSFSDSIVLVDEAQNFTPYEMKQLMTRVARGSKMVITGDLTGQIDNPQNRKDYNGLAFAIKQFLRKPYTMAINLTQNERSHLAEDAAGTVVYQR